MDALDFKIAQTQAANAALDRFREYIDETTPTITIMDVNYDPSRVFEEVDPVGFRSYFCNYTDGWCDTCYEEDTESGEPHAEWCPEFTEESDDDDD